MGPVDLERRRMLAAELFEQGVKQAEIGRLLGVSRQAVGQWHAAWVAGGADALVGHVGGAAAYLTLEQEEAVLAELKRGAQAFGWEDQWWTLARIARVSIPWNRAESWSWICRHG
ncbi:helix-turn-helix domain-containing protein [Streptacidiphilus albus]|nr:helix-turn-helix domain-containing protein [Streptacidiphilus albus]